MAAYYKALAAGQILPRWAADLNYGYGMPLFIFIYHTPYLISSIFIAMGTGLVATFKIVIALSFLLSGIGMLLFSRTFFHSKRVAFFVAIFYQFAPFRLAETHIRGSFGEVYTYASLPFFLYGLTKISQNQTIASFIIASLSGALLIFSHNSVSLLFFIFAVVFAFITSNNDKARIVISGAILCALTISLTYWLPALLERKYTYGDLYMKKVYESHFSPFLSIIAPNFINDAKLYTEGVPVQIGLFHVLALSVTLVSLFGTSDQNKSRGVKLLIALGSFFAIFFMSTASKPVWATLPLLRQFQFPWRFLSILVVTTALGAGYVAAHQKLRKPLLYWSALCLTVVSTLWYWRPPLGFDKPIDEKYYWNFPLNTTYYGETDVIWSAGPAKGYAKVPVDVFGGDAVLTDVIKRPTIHTFRVTASKPSRLVDNTQYFPGWNVYLDGKKIPVQFQDANWRGLVTFEVPPGSHDVRVAFERSRIRWIADSVSAVTLIILCFLFIGFRTRRLST